MKKALLSITLLLYVVMTYGVESIEINSNWTFFNKYQPWTERYGSPRKSKVVNLPHDWSIEGGFDKESPSGFSGGYLSGGVALYRKDDIFIPESWSDKKVFIEFEGVYQNSDLYVNGVLLGRRPNGYISFYNDITEWVDFGTQNMLAVKVTNDDMPNCRWYSGSGIYRPVHLFAVDRLHFEHWSIFASTPTITEELAVVDVSYNIINDYEEIKHFTVKHQIFDDKGREVASSSRQEQLVGGAARAKSQSLVVKEPSLWCPESPYLYTLKSSIISGEEVINTEETTFGIRSIEFNATNGFVLNGVPTKLKGVCLHHDGGMVGAAVPPMLWERRLKTLKDMGCNAVRTSHNPFEPAFYNLCDSLGIMVMDELFDEWTVHTLDHVPNGYNKYWDEWHERDIKDFVMRDRNHPSVVIWSVGNEIMEQAFPEGHLIARNLVELFHELDPTRPVTCGNNKPHEANRTGFADEFDVVGYNYAPMFDTYEPDRDSYPERVMIGTESTRGNSTRGYYAFPLPENGMVTRTKDEYFSSYDGKARIYGMEHEWQVTKELDWVSGMFIWTGIDYIGETSWPWPTKYSDFGAIDACGFPKDAYYFYRSVWNEKETTLHILPHWNWTGREGQVTPVWCYTSCDEVELLLNGRSLGRRNFKTTDKLHLEWSDVKYEAGELRAIGYKGGKKVAEQRVATTGAPAKVKLEVDRKTLRKGTLDIAHITVSVVDSKGRHIADANTPLNYSVKGGRLLGIDNGDPKYVDSFQKLKDRELFNGLSLVIVQAAEKEEKIEITVSGEGIAPVSMTINVK